MKLNEADLKDHDSIAAIFMKGCGVIPDADTKYLVQDHVKWNILTFPCGKVDPTDPNLYGALIREMREEVGVDVKRWTPFGKFVKEYLRENKFVTVDTHVFIVDGFDGEIKNMEPEKCRELKWMTEDEILHSGRKLADCVKYYFENT